MTRFIRRTMLALGGGFTVALLSGCDSAGVTDIVFGALQLAFGIIDVAT